MRFLPLLSLIFLSFITSAQNASLSGKITGPQSEAVPYASVALQKSDVIITADAEGQYRFESLTPGEYSLIISSPGFTTTTRRVQLKSGENKVLT